MPECPCIHETPENLTIDSRTKTLIITVHGTNAKHAKWTYNGDLVASLVNRNHQTQVSRFCWSGGNSHAKRLKASKDLANHLRELMIKYPDLKFYLIGHSHGGNVIMYALNNLRATKDENRVKKIITLATPFIYMKLRKLNPLIIYSSFILATFCLLELMLGGWQFNTNYFASTVVSIFSAWQFMLLLSIIWNKNRFKRLGQYSKILLGKDRDLSILEDEISDFDLEHRFLEPVDIKVNKTKKLSSNRQLIIRPVGDEATMALTVSQFLLWINVRLLKITSNICDRHVNLFIRTIKEYFYRLGSIFGLGPTYVIREDMDYEEMDKVWAAYADRMEYREFIGGLFSFILTAIPVIFMFCPLAFPNISNNTILIAEESLTSPFGMFLFIFGIFILIITSTFILIGAILCLLGIISVLSLFFLTLSALPFGIDSVFWSHFSQTTVESTPPGLSDVYVHPIGEEIRVDKEVELAHSLIYEDIQVIRRIERWMFQS